MEEAPDMDPEAVEAESKYTGTAAAEGCPSETSMAGRADVCQGCPGRSLCLSQAGVDPDQRFIDVRMKAIRRKIVVVSGKGGVGKSTIAACLATALATQLSAKVGILDLDICGPSMPKLMAVEGGKVENTPYGWTPLKSPHGQVSVMSVGSLLEDEDSAVVWRGPRKTALIKRFMKDTFWGRLDYLIFGTSDEHLTVIKALANAKPDGAVIVTTPQEVAMATIRRELSFCRTMKLRVIGIVENMSGFSCPCCQERWPLFSQGGAEKLASQYGIPFLGSVPLDPNLVRCCEVGGSVFSESPETPAASALLELARAIHT